MNYPSWAYRRADNVSFSVHMSHVGEEPVVHAEHCIWQSLVRHHMALNGFVVVDGIALSWHKLVFWL